MPDGIWATYAKEMTVGDALLVSLCGIATVFVTLIALALAIILLGKILGAMGLTKAPEKKTLATASSSASTSASVAAKPVEEDMEEYAVILAAVSEHTRTPIDRLKVKSITKR